MKIVITGASGYVADLLIPYLNTNNNQLLLVTRDVKNLKKKFENFSICNYKDFEKNVFDYDLIIHLAVANNNLKGSYEYFYKTNVDFLKKIFLISQKNKIKFFLNISSIHVKEHSKNTYYAITKKIGHDQINRLKFKNQNTIFLPYIYGNKWSSRLRFLNYLPLFISKNIFRFVSAFKVTLSIEKLVEYIEKKKYLQKHSDKILYDEKSDNYFFNCFKRIVDLSFSIVTILFFLWLIIVIYLLIKLETRGPSFIIQKRIGYKCKVFHLYKFRTMRQNTKLVPTHKISKDQVTNVGKFLRKFKLDELPQVLNILKNELTLVGPRPCLTIQKKLINCRLNNGIYNLKPGLTGLAQIKNIDMKDINRLVKVEKHYLERRCIFMDLSIIFKTFLGKGLKDKTN